MKATMAVVFLVVASELGLRIYAAAVGGYPAFQDGFSDLDSPDFVYVSASQWDYDAELGFTMRPGFAFRIGSVNGGVVTGCSSAARTVWPKDLPSSPSWRDAQLKIALFGADDALVQPEWSGRTWPAWLGEALSEQLDRRVEVANFSRPGVGLVQSVEMAARIVPETQPDLVVFALPTPTIGRARIWRDVGPIHGTDQFLVAGSAELRAKPDLGHSAVGAVISEGVTEEWCASVAAAAGMGLHGFLKRDPVTNAMVRQFNMARAFEARPVHIEWKIRWPAFLAGALNSGDIFEFTVAPVARPSIGGLPILDIAVDERFLRAVERLKALETPYLILHSPIYPELLAGSLLPKYSGFVDDHFRALIASFERAMETPLVSLVDFVEGVLPDGRLLINNPESDWQLRAAGAALYGRLAARAVLAQVSDGRLQLPGTAE